MTEQPKYYTPDISEFHVGFKCELLLGDLIGWESHIFSPIENFNGIQKYLDEQLIRVKFLDKEDIESLGWKHMGSLWFEKNTYKLRKWTKNNVLMQRAHPGEEDETLFSGDILNKSELSRIMKMVGI